MKNLKNPKISVIIPVYNSEKYIFTCLDSLKKQTYKDFEAIIINDGCTDSSINIIKEFTDKYENFYLITNSNQGVSESRNIAIKHSRGEYLSFIDSDDFVAPNFLEVLYESICSTNADISCCGYYSYSIKCSKKRRDLFMVSSGSYSSEKLLQSLIKDFRMHFYVWNKLFKKTLFMSNDITFPNMCFEDIIVTTKLFYYSNIISIVNKPYYYYTKHQGSLVSKIDKLKLNDYMKSLMLIRRFLEKENVFIKYRSSFNLYATRMIITNIKLIFFICLEEKSFKGFLKSIYRSTKIIIYFMRKNYKTFNRENDMYDFIKIFKI